MQKSMKREISKYLTWSVILPNFKRDWYPLHSTVLTVIVCVIRVHFVAFLSRVSRYVRLWIEMGDGWKFVATPLGKIVYPTVTSARSCNKVDHLFWFTILAQHETNDVILYIHSVHKHWGNTFQRQNYKMSFRWD